MRTTLMHTARFLAVILIGLYPVSSSAAAQGGQPAAPQVRRLAVDEAVRIALENNLGVQIARVDPLIQDLSVAQARGVWTPAFTTTLQTSGADSPNNSFLSGAQGTKT